MKENGHQKKDAKIWLAAVACLAMISIMVFCLPEHAISGAQNDPEAQAVMQAAINYFDAEVRRDYASVYGCFAPSSDYVRLKNYEQYLGDVKKAGDRVVKYRIVAISYIEKNSNRLLSINIEKVAEVETDVTLLNTETGKRSDVNIGFIFLKEKGKWYKS